MDNQSDKPLYALSVSEFRQLTREIVLEILSGQQANAAPASDQPLPKNQEEHFTICELSKFLRCSRMSIYNYKKLGLPFYRLGRKILFKKTEVLEFMRRCFGRENFGANKRKH
jgi:excisionase family DNA binding protein